jgi:diguanylate cyclase (GGDEF)-like protein
LKAETKGTTSGTNMPQQTTLKQLAVYVDNLDRGFLSGFEFPGTLEGNFRKYYSHIGAYRARLMPFFALIMTLVSAAIVILGDGDQKLFTAIWNFAFFIPLLVATLYMSTIPDRYRLYQKLLAVSGLVSGLVVSSLYFRPSLEGMPSYFSMGVTWILAVWLILGLRFLPAAAVALIVSFAHIGGIVFLDYAIPVLGYQIGMLFLVNTIGATCCYHIERTTRRSFLESLELDELTKELKLQAELDPLTGLNNRRTYDTYVDRLWRQSKRDLTPLALFLIDIDNFKEYNDHFGHQAGDEALVAVAEVIRAHANRPLDFVARYGGEEFVLALHNPGEASDWSTEKSFSYACAEDLRANIMALQIPHAPTASYEYLTVSIGVSVIMPDADRSLAGALQMADEALYQAKELGRNRVVIRSDIASFHTGMFRVEKETA